MRYYLFMGLLFSILFLAGCNNDPDVPTTPTAVLPPQETLGRDLFSRHCAPCHTVSGGSVIVGPSLATIATVAETRVEGQDARTYLYTAILQPGDHLVEGYDNLMPSTFGKTLTGEELDAVVAYLLTLK